jgi:signal transduction histidine kinase
MNLLFNVERFAYPSETGGRVEIGIHATSQDQVPSFVLTVQDYGKGIAPEHLSQVFTPFFTTGRASGGTGLGSAIVYSIVTGALQGTIEIESELEKGTLVRATFPQTVPGPSAA